MRECMHLAAPSVGYLIDISMNVPTPSSEPRYGKYPQAVPLAHGHVLLQAPQLSELALPHTYTPLAALYLATYSVSTTGCVCTAHFHQKAPSQLGRRTHVAAAGNIRMPVVSMWI